MDDSKFRGDSGLYEALSPLNSCKKGKMTVNFELFIIVNFSISCYTKAANSMKKR